MFLLLHSPVEIAGIFGWGLLVGGGIIAALWGAKKATKAPGK